MDQNQFYELITEDSSVGRRLQELGSLSQP